MERGYFGDVLTWMHDEDIDEKVFRVRRKGSGNYYEKGMFLQVIELPNDFLIGVLRVDDHGEDDIVTCVNKEVDFYLLSELDFIYLESDQADELE